MVRRERVLAEGDHPYILRIAIVEALQALMHLVGAVLDAVIRVLHRVYADVPRTENCWEPEDREEVETYLLALKNSLGPKCSWTLGALTRADNRLLLSSTASAAEMPEMDNEAIHGPRLTSIGIMVLTESYQD